LYAAYFPGFADSWFGCLAARNEHCACCSRTSHESTNRMKFCQQLMLQSKGFSGTAVFGDKVQEPMIRDLSDRNPDFALITIAPIAVLCR
jgi:hypothetical protein